MQHPYIGSHLKIYLDLIQELIAKFWFKSVNQDESYNPHIDKHVFFQLS